MTRVALVEAKHSRNNYQQYFDDAFEFDQYQLCSDPSIKRILKRDCDINIDLDLYDWIILIGSEALKYFTKVTAITTYSGKSVDEKFLPIINPGMLAFKPEARGLWEKSKDSINGYISGEIVDKIIDDTIAIGIDNTREANTFIRDAIEYPKDYVSLDSETTALYPRNGYMQGASISYDGKKAAYITTDCFDETTENLLQELFNKKIVIFHNAKFDIAFFEYHFGFKFPRFEDTMLLHYLIDENPGNHGLKKLSLHFTPYGDYEKPLREWSANYRRAHGVRIADFDWACIPFEEMYTYAAMDALCTFILFERFVKIKKNPDLKKVYDEILIPGCRFLIDVQDNGIPFNSTRLEAAQQLMQTEIDSAIEKLYTNGSISEFEEMQGKQFNPNSVIQLRTLLFDYLGLKPTGKKTPKGADSTDAEVLKKLASQSDIPALILDIRQKSKIKNTYLDKILPQLDRDGHIRTNYNLHSTTSGRLSSSGKFNMQQLPRDNPIVKGCIQAKKGNKIVAMDLTTAEVYAAAVLSGDKALMNVFRQGEDFHSSIAKAVFHLPCPVEDVKELYPTQRQAAKAVSFGIMYGAGPTKISETVTQDSGEYFSIREATATIDTYFKTFYKLRDWIDNNIEFITQNGFIYSHFGRKRRLPNVFSKDIGERSHNVRSGLNFLVQSVASDINLLGAIEMQNYIKEAGMKAKIFALVHDSILAEVPDKEVEYYKNILQSFIQTDRGLSIPETPIGCDFDIGQDYSMGKFDDKYGDLNV